METENSDTERTAIAFNAASSKAPDALGDVQHMPVTRTSRKRHFQENKLVRLVQW